jgi:hypothetical protein
MAILFRSVFRQFLSISGADENGWSQRRNFLRPLCPFCIRIVSIGKWDRALKNHQILTPPL